VSLGSVALWGRVCRTEIIQLKRSLIFVAVLAFAASAFAQDKPYSLKGFTVGESTLQDFRTQFRHCADNCSDKAVKKSSAPRFAPFCSDDHPEARLTPTRTHARGCSIVSRTSRLKSSGDLCSQSPTFPQRHSLISTKTLNTWALHPKPPQAGESGRPAPPPMTAKQLDALKNAAKFIA
jgi:hypothetical protein